jgi:hypothetical protein
MRTRTMLLSPELSASGFEPQALSSPLPAPSSKLE